MSTAHAIDFEQVKRDVTFEHAIRLLDLKLRPDGPNAWRGQCPACNGDARSLKVTEGRGFYCHAAKRGGDQIALVGHIRGLKPLDAAKFLAGTGSGTVPGNSSRKSDTVRHSSPSTGRSFDPDEYARELKADHEALLGLGLAAETFRRFDAGYQAKGRLAGRLAVRIDDAQGGFSTFMGLALKGEEPPRKFGRDDYDATRILFNAKRVEGGEVRLVRDVIEVMTIYDQTGEDCVCFLTELIAPEQFELLAILQTERKFACYT